MIKNTFLALSLILVFGLNSIAQSTEAPPKKKREFWERIYVGGDISLNFGSVTLIGASPLIGYRITDRWSAGVGGTYLYFSQNIDGFGKYSTSLYGGNVFTRFLITDQIFAQSEYHIVNLEAYDFASNSLGRKNIPIWYVGGGYRTQIGGNSWIMIMALFDLIDDINSPYTNPQIRGGVSIGL